MRSTRLVGAAMPVAIAATVLVTGTGITTAQATPTGNTESTVTATVAPAVVPPAVAPLTPEQIREAKAAQRRAKAIALRKKVVKFAKSRLGRGQYVAGAESSWAFDCSGFTKVVYKRAANINIPHYSGAQLNMRRGIRVSKQNLLPGDILAWGSNGSQHVSIYIGKGKMIGANNPTRDVVIEPINSAYWSPRYAGARRLIVG